MHGRIGFSIRRRRIPPKRLSHQARSRGLPCLEMRKNVIYMPTMQDTCS